MSRGLWRGRANWGGGVDEAELLNLIVISIFGGVDTTRAQLGFLVRLSSGIRVSGTP